MQEYLMLKASKCLFYVLREDERLMNGCIMQTLQERNICRCSVVAIFSFHTFIFTSSYGEHNIIICFFRMYKYSECSKLLNPTSACPNNTFVSYPFLLLMSVSWLRRKRGNYTSEVSTGTKPQVTCFLQLPTPDTQVHAQRCRPVHRHTHP